MSKQLFIPILDNGSGSVRLGYFRSYIESFAGRNISTCYISDSLASRARNRAAAEFLKSDCEYLLFIDADIRFTSENIDLISEGEEPIVCGIYFIKDQDEMRPCLNHFPEDAGKQMVGRWPVKRAGTGFMRIHRSVFEAMQKGYRDIPGEPIYQMPFWKAIEYGNHGEPQWDFFRVGALAGEYLSEDWWFCDAARALGFQVLVDTRILLWHEGWVAFPLKTQPLTERESKTIPGL